MDSIQTKKALAAYMIADAQLSGVFDYPRLRRAIDGIYDVRADVHEAHPIEAALKHGDDPHKDTSQTHALLHDATSTIAACAGRLAAGIDTTNPMSWLWLEDMLTSAARLAAVPEYVDRAFDGLSGYDFVMQACTLTDMFMVLANDMDAVDFDRVARIYLDVLCGRAGIWVSVTETLGFEAACASGDSWETLRGTYASVRMQQVAAALARTRPGIAARDLMNTASRMLLAFTDLIDTRQARLAGAVDREAWELALGGSVVPERMLEIAGEAARLPQPAWPGLRGYCALADVPPLACAFLLPDSCVMDIQTVYAEAMR